MKPILKLLVVDVGNTSTAVGFWVNGKVRHISHCDNGFEEAVTKVKEFLNLGVQALAYLSVVPSVDKLWKKFAQQNNLPFFQVNHTLFPVTCGTQILQLDYPKPKTIGADRLADAAAAVSRYGAPVIVCDFGTAFTAAAITADTIWRGGVIAPGFPLMRDYLFERTAKLPRMKLGGKCPKIGKSTAQAMCFGALVGYRGMVREIVNQLQQNFQTSFKLVATGGFARWVLKDLDLPFIIDPTLTLYGAGYLVAQKYFKQNGKDK